MRPHAGEIVAAPDTTRSSRKKSFSQALTVRSGQTVLQQCSGWSASPDSVAITVATGDIGTFQLDPAQRDACLLISLPPGAHTVELSSATGESGTGLVEIYEVP